LPLERDRLLVSKLAYAATVTLSTSLVLTLVSELMLGLLDPGTWPIGVLHLLAMLLLSLGLSAISVGLGAWLVNLKESNPSKIATGYGGTMNLLVSLVFTVAAVFLAGLPTFIYFALPAAGQYDDHLQERLWPWLGLCAGGLIVLGVAAVVIPLRLGIRAFRRMEF
jgi:ABC-2 type transport system permease protein